MASVQFNLLPDVKLNYIQADRNRNRVLSIAIIVGGASLAIFILLLFSVHVVQKKQLSDANKTVTATNRQLQQIPNINQVVTVQNQLNTLSNLHRGKHVSSRIFSYLTQVTPLNIKIGTLAADFTTNTMIISGTADSQRTANIFIDSLKFTTYKVNDQDAAKPAFSNVLETSFSLTGNSSYSITLTFDPQLFSNNLSQAPVLSVPKLTSTRANNDPGSVLFNGDVGGSNKPGGQ